MKNRMILIPILLITVLFTFSCQRAAPVLELSDNYYPLGYGYEWYYQQLESTPFVTKIIEETEINGKTYFRNENDYSDHIRSENNKLYQLHDSTEYLVIDFNRSTGSEWNHPIYDRTYTILAKNATFDTISNCIIISSESDLDYSETMYAPGIGQVSSHVEGRNGIIIICGDSWLTSAIINEQTICF